MEYRIFKHEGSRIWSVYSVYMTYGFLNKDAIQFSSESLADCYAWIKAKQEGLLG